MAKKSNAPVVAIIVGVVMFLLGGAAVGLLLMMGADEPENNVLKIIMYVCIGIAGVGIITVIAGIVIGNKHSRQRTAEQINNYTQSVDEVEINLDGAVSYNGEPSYVPQEDAYEFVTVGKRQSMEDKFDQMSKMGKTQFVIYIAKLFSLKGYEVQLTPVMDNHDIDMVVKKDGITRAVGCLVADKVMCEENIAPIQSGSTFYNVDYATVVTNMFYDRTALNFAKTYKMTLIDRNILAERFMA
ncbi:MAG: restriction endonuclease [Clostridia bacterium]|nr:restriction endonuclease [Clostridia bacterium]